MSLSRMYSVDPASNYISIPPYFPNQADHPVTCRDVHLDPGTIDGRRDYPWAPTPEEAIKIVDAFWDDISSQVTSVKEDSFMDRRESESPEDYALRIFWTSVDLWMGHADDVLCDAYAHEDFR